MAGLDVAEKRLPQDGRIKVRVNDKDIDVRVSIIPSAFGEQVVMRLLDRGGALIGLDSVGMNPEFEKTIVSLMTRPQGVFLVTGPTGIRQDNYPLCGAPVHQHAGEEYPYRGGPG